MIVLVSLIVLLKKTPGSHCFSHDTSLHQHSFSRMIFTLVIILYIYTYLTVFSIPTEVAEAFIRFIAVATSAICWGIEGQCC